jgi:hypothetical protein
MPTAAGYPAVRSTRSNTAGAARKRTLARWRPWLAAHLKRAAQGVDVIACRINSYASAATITE